jgi:hypothetical protein
MSSLHFGTPHSAVVAVVRQRLRLLLLHSMVVMLVMMLLLVHCMVGRQQVHGRRVWSAKDAALGRRFLRRRRTHNAMHALPLQRKRVGVFKRSRVRTRQIAHCETGLD